MRPADFPRVSVGSPFHDPPPCPVLRHQASKVRTGPPTDLHRFLHGVVYLMRTGIPWQDLTPRFGHWNSVFRRYRCWCLA